MIRAIITHVVFAAAVSAVAVFVWHKKHYICQNCYTARDYGYRQCVLDVRDGAVRTEFKEAKP